ncbi:response regulator [Mastigocoleus testarum]|uniref:Two-component system response regulator n=1 Tax=Mastigocoleus testarum BC008 TaxID=371196 RepID=A0A0V7ZLW4_9CYAN|nr:response regulator [Mastigocoleus testarum]KST65406.1 two-component system response regulator [Mastigocoleus testarum BC008]KST70470.1 two-component system response regulator [Mastigocoleus testarum BC008]
MSSHLSSILLVEDNSNDVLLIKRAFKQAKLKNHIEIVPDGEAAIAYLSRGEPYADCERYPMPTLILLDLKLPRRHGLEVLKWLRQQPELKRIIVIILTASRENPDIVRAYDLGVNSYLVKPVGFTKLVELITQVDKYWFNLNEKPLLSNGWNP